MGNQSHGESVPVVVQGAPQGFLLSSFRNEKGPGGNDTQTWVLISALPLTSCVNLDVLLDHPEPQPAFSSTMGIELTQ